jgi:hypothetical protein
VIKFEEQGEEKHGERKGEDGKKDLRMPDTDKTEDDGKDQRKEEGGRDQYLQGIGLREVFGDHRNGISARGKIGAVAERQKAGVPQEEIEPQTDDGESDSVFKEHEVMDRENGGDKQ